MLLQLPFPPLPSVLFLPLTRKPFLSESSRFSESCFSLSPCVPLSPPQPSAVSALSSHATRTGLGWVP